MLPFWAVAPAFFLSCCSLQFVTLEIVTSIFWQRYGCQTSKKQRVYFGFTKVYGTKNLCQIQRRKGRSVSLTLQHNIHSCPTHTIFVVLVSGILKGYDALVNLVLDDTIELPRSMCLTNFILSIFKN